VLRGFVPDAEAVHHLFEGEFSTVVNFATANADSEIVIQRMPASTAVFTRQAAPAVEVTMLVRPTVGARIVLSCSILAVPDVGVL
jgi:hypothetical protein